MTELSCHNLLEASSSPADITSHLTQFPETSHLLESNLLMSPHTRQLHRLRKRFFNRALPLIGVRAGSGTGAGGGSRFLGRGNSFSQSWPPHWKAQSPALAPHVPQQITSFCTPRNKANFRFVRSRDSDLSMSRDMRMGCGISLNHPKAYSLGAGCTSMKPSLLTSTTGPMVSPFFVRSPSGTVS